MKKIMFNDVYGLTAAVLNGTKTQTRRLVHDKLLSRYGHNKFNNRSNDMIHDATFKVGDVVAVAQKYYDVWNDIKATQDALTKATIHLTKGWDNKMFVKANYMPNKIQISDIRVQRLQDISDEDCLAEGVIKYANGVYTYIESGKKFFHRELDTPKKAFAALIDKINGKNTWERNPWVFAYSFTLIK